MIVADDPCSMGLKLLEGFVQISLFEHSTAIPTFQGGKLLKSFCAHKTSLLIKYLSKPPY